MEESSSSESSDSSDDEYKESERYAEIFNLDDFKTLKKIGRSKTTEVYKVKKKSTGKMYAKKVFWRGISRPDGLENTRKVITDLINKSPGKHVVKYYHFHIRIRGDSDFELSVFSEYMNCGSIERIRKVHKEFPEHQISKIIDQVLQSLKYFHEDLNTIYNNLDCDDVLCNDLGECKLSGYGSLEEILKKKTFNAWTGNFGPLSPERVMGQKITNKSDCWSVGILAANLAIGKSPTDVIFRDTSNLFEMVNRSERLKGEDYICGRLDLHSEEFKDFLNHSIEFYPTKRCSISQLLEHPFITNHRDINPSFRGWLHKRFIRVMKSKIFGKVRKKMEKVFVVEDELDRCSFLIELIISASEELQQQGKECEKIVFCNGISINIKFFLLIN